MKKQFLKSKPIVKVTFNVAPEVINGAKEVLVLGEFNGWNKDSGLNLKKQKDGSFKGALELEQEKEYQFRYLVDGVFWANEAAADGEVINSFGEPNSVVSTRNTAETEAPVKEKKKKKKKD